MCLFNLHTHIFIYKYNDIIYFLNIEFEKRRVAICNYYIRETKRTTKRS
jgi:hypothetical protein